LPVCKTLCVSRVQAEYRGPCENIGKYSYDSQSHSVSADGFLYTSRVVVVNSKAFYDAVLRDPTAIPNDMESESLLGLAPTAYELEAGDEFEYSTGCSFEMFHC
jgi:hypothetical protein